MAQSTKDIKQALLIMSGKGGVGKSTLTSQLAITYASKGMKVGVIDVDLCGPSQARMLGVEDAQVTQTEKGWQPVKVRRDLDLYLMSMALLTNNKDAAVIWRGPKKHFMIDKFINNVAWGQLDMLLIDTPPGTSDEHISLIEVLSKIEVPIRALLVTTPQIISCNDVRREINLCQRTGIDIVGIVENMSGYVCAHCNECTKIFSSRGGESLCEMANLKFLGSVPIDPNLCECGETGKSFIERFRQSTAAKVFNDVTDSIKY